MSMYCIGNCELTIIMYYVYTLEYAKISLRLIYVLPGLLCGLRVLDALVSS